jgi:hypothetical protein
MKIHIEYAHIDVNEFVKIIKDFKKNNNKNMEIQQQLTVLIDE